MKTVTTVQENAGDVLAEAKQINEDRAAEEMCIRDRICSVRHLGAAACLPVLKPEQEKYDKK